MIKIFRKIRYNLMETGKTSRYIKYAIGEIILVVIGILIALQINNWNDKRKLREQEQQILGSLLSEFKSNKVILDETVALIDSIMFNINQIGNYTGPSTVVKDENEMSNLMLGAFKEDIEYLPVQGSFEEIMNSGKLNLISNTKIREAIGSWKTNLEAIKKQEDYVLRRRDLAHEYFINQGNFRRHLKLLSGDKMGVTSSEFPKNDFEFLRNQSFESNLYLYLASANATKQEFYLPTFEFIDRLIEMLSAEIQTMH